METGQYGDHLYGAQEGRAYIYSTTAKRWTALVSPGANAEYKTSVLSQRAYEGPFTWLRRGDVWTLERIDFSKNAKSNELKVNPKNLYLVIQDQSPGEPFHWSLFIAAENSNGDVYQVKGDAENMHYTHATDVPIFRSASYNTSFVMISSISESGEAWVKHFATTIAPPKAANRKEVKENCQGWSYRVLCALHEKGLVSSQKVSEVRQMIQPIA